MSAEELKLILEALAEMGDDAKQAFIAYIVA